MGRGRGNRVHHPAARRLAIRLSPGWFHVTDPTKYVLGQSPAAARRLAIQDRQFAGPSERLLDLLDLRPADRVVELGCGPGGLTRRLLRRLGPAGVVVGVDASTGLLDQARAAVEGAGPGRFEPVAADLTTLGEWLAGADVVVGRAVLHHVARNLSSASLFSPPR